MTRNLVSSAIWEHIFSSMHNGVIVVDRDNKILLCNTSAEKLLQIDSQKWIGKDIKQLILNSRMHEVLAGGESSIGQKLVIADRVCMVNRTPLFQDGEMIGAIAVIQDISEMEQYRNLSLQMEAIIEFSTDGIYVVNQEGMTVLVNSAYEEMTGFRREELIGRHMAKLMEEGYFDQSVSLLVLEKKERISIMQKINGKKEVIVTGNPVFNEQGELEMVVTSVRDITHLNEMRRELDKAKSFSRIQQNRYTFEIGGSDQGIIFRSKKMKQIYDQIEQVAPYPTSILLYGPSGSGKEVISNLVHNLSDRKEQPFIKVNCGAIPEQLLESELFGYEAGAFTGASRNGKIGLLELANGGTVLFDEIGELPLQLQVKLLRALQEKQIQRIGGTKLLDLDIRIISATNQDLKKLIQEGKFREDLYYRLAVVEISVPPLVDRQEDVDVLIDHYFSFFCRQFRIDKELANETKELLKAYHWPGNVRELRNQIESMIVSVPSRIVEPYHLPLHIHDQSSTNSSRPLKELVQQFERRIIKEAIEKHKSLRKTAKQLGIDHSTLVKKMQKWENQS